MNQDVIFGFIMGVLTAAIVVVFVRCILEAAKEAISEYVKRLPR